MPLRVSASSPLSSTAAIDIKDDILFTIGDGGDQVLLNRSTTLTADAELASVIVGTSVHPGAAANSLVISNVTTDGDILILASDGGNSKACLLFDSSAPNLYLYNVGGTWTAGATTWTIPAVTLGGAVAGGDQSFTGVGDMTFTAGSILVAAAANTSTLLVKAGGISGTTVMTVTSLDAGDTLGLANVTSLVATGNLDIGAFDLRAATLTADGLTATRVVFAGANGVLSDDSDMTFATATLTVTNITVGTLVTIGSGSAGHSPTSLYCVGTAEFDDQVHFDYPVQCYNSFNIQTSNQGIYGNSTINEYYHLYGYDTTATAFQSVLKITNAAVIKAQFAADTLLGFFGATEVAQQAHIADATDATDVITRANAILAVLEAFGLVAAS